MGSLTQRLGRASAFAGYERDSALLLVKSAMAGVLSWVLAEYVISSAQPTYAPFVALLVVQSTVYRSLLHSVQYVAAVIVGVLAAGAASPLLGENPGAFAAMLGVGLLAGRWQRLGTMGVQVPIAGIFAYDALLGVGKATVLWSIVSMVLLGAGVGLAVNLLLLPPMRYATADQGVEELSTALASLLQDMAEELREGTPEPDSVQEWQRRARQLDTTVSKAHRAVGQGAESVSYNPRRIFRKHRAVSFAGYRTMVQTLERASEQVRGIAFGLRNLLEEASGQTAGAAFFRPYAEIIELVARGTEYLGSTAEDAEAKLRQTADVCYGLCERLEAETKGDSAWPALGGLVTEAARLVEELGNAHARGAIRAD